MHQPLVPCSSAHVCVTSQRLPLSVWVGVSPPAGVLQLLIQQWFRGGQHAHTPFVRTSSLSPASLCASLAGHRIVGDTDFTQRLEDIFLSSGILCGCQLVTSRCNNCFSLADPSPLSWGFLALLDECSNILLQRVWVWICTYLSCSG